MKQIKQQQGLSPLGWLLVLFLLSFFGMCTFRIAPLYFDNRILKESLKNLSDNGSQIEEMTNESIRRQLNKSFLLNNLRNFNASDVKIDRTENSTVVTMAYEVRVPIFLNIDAIVSFNNVWDSSRPYECCKPPRE